MNKEELMGEIDIIMTDPSFLKCFTYLALEGDEL